MSDDPALRADLEPAEEAAAAQKPPRHKRVGDFISADWPEYAFNQGEEEEEEEEEEEDLEEADIYRVVGNGRLLILNRMRGLQLLDVSNLGSPRVIARLPLNGYPVEMVVDEGRAVILMNGWQDVRQGGSGQLFTVSEQGAAVVMVQISGDTLTLRDVVQVPGYLRTSRYANGEDRDILYVAASGWRWVDEPDGGRTWQYETTVKSIEVLPWALVARSELLLGGNVTAITGRKDVLLVAAHDHAWRSPSSKVTLIDLSAEDGSMLPAGSVTVEGYVRTRFHMDFRGRQLRVFSGPQWGTQSSSWLQTWDATDLWNPTPLDSESFGQGQSLYGAIFLEDRAFAVTYLRVDPFHAFSISAEGQVEEVSEFIVSGWNDFFRPFADGRRLIGIGIDDAGGTRKVAVSLYDITDLANPNPLLARANAQSDDWNWSTANWDHRAFNVLEDVVRVHSPQGHLEQHLVMVPFSGYRQVGSSWVWSAGVQIFSFSEHSLTPRAVMDHEGNVLRTFQVAPDRTANLSDFRLDIHDTTSVDAPVRTGSVELVRDDRGIYSFGDFRVRVSRRPWSYGGDPSPQLLEVIPANGHAGTVSALSSVELPAHARLFQVGRTLVALSQSYSAYPTVQSELQVVDFSSPLSPRLAGRLQTDVLPSAGTIWRRSGSFPNHVATDGHLVLAGAREQVEGSETVEMCRRYPASSQVSCDERQTCTYQGGQEQCVREGDKGEFCRGGFTACTLQAQTLSCEPLTRAAAGSLKEYCSRWQKQGRARLQLELHAVDLRTPDAPMLLPTLLTPGAEDAYGLLGDGHRVFLKTKVSVGVRGSDKPHARHYLRELWLQSGLPSLGEPQNVPGEVLVIGGHRLIAQDHLWDGDHIRPALSLAKLTSRGAQRLNHQPLPQRTIQRLLTSDPSLVVAVEQAPSAWWPERMEHHEGWISVYTPSITTEGFDLRSQVTLPRYSWPQELQSRRLTVQTYSGLVVADLDDPDRPHSQAYLRNAWNAGPMLVSGKEIVVPGGYAGFFQLGRDEVLLPRP